MLSILVLIVVLVSFVHYLIGIGMRVLLTFVYLVLNLVLAILNAIFLMVGVFQIVLVYYIFYYIVY